MGYVDGYDYDYFLSYAHVDNEPVPGTDAQEGWVSLFFEALNYELKALSGGRIRSPWKDGKIPLHKPLDGELIGGGPRGGARGAAVAGLHPVRLVSEGTSSFPFRLLHPFFEHQDRTCHRAGLIAPIGAWYRGLEVA